MTEVAYEVLSRFADVPPPLVASRALLRRIDRKYTLPAQQLDQVLGTLSHVYGVLRAGDAVAARYRTIYFDTPDLRLYHAHRRGRSERFKVRVRHHVDRGMSFVEVKHRTAFGQSVKFVLPRPFGVSSIDGEARSFIESHCPIGGHELSPQLWVAFRRITLVGYRLDERITIDCGLEYGNDRASERWPAAAIAEVKQGRRTNSTPAVQALRGARARERSISKYCVATSRLTDTPGNAFKPALRALEQASQ
jgi:hypothetical protein